MCSIVVLLLRFCVSLCVGLFRIYYPIEYSFIEYKPKIAHGAHLKHDDRILDVRIAPVYSRHRVQDHLEALLGNNGNKIILNNTISISSD